MKYSILLVNNNRSKAYLQNFIKAGFSPEYAIVLHEEFVVRPENTFYDFATTQSVGRRIVRRSVDAGVEFDINEQVWETLRKNKIDYDLLPTFNVNSTQVISVVKNAPGKYILYSGPGGTILRKDILSQGKAFIHSHPGWLPLHRGSTTVYYSLLLDKTVSCTVFIMAETIDTGPVLLRKRYQLTETTMDYDYVLDPCVRTAALLEFFSNSSRYLDAPLDLSKEKTNTFYIIHPVLKHLSILYAQRTLEGKTLE